MKLELTREEAQHLAAVIGVYLGCNSISVNTERAASKSVLSIANRITAELGNQQEVEK
jgi:hypothetical protein